MSSDKLFQFTPIGYISCKERYKYEQPRQGSMQSERSILKLLPGHNYEQALSDLDGFSHIWLIFVFDQNSGWKAKVNPPRLTTGQKVGLFATRSPYRPNSIGLSCVKLEKIEGLNLYLSGSDLLDGTPILDIKPYLTYCDSFPEANCGWVSNNYSEDYEIKFTQQVAFKLDWLKQNSNLGLDSFIQTQLSLEPLNGKKKRIKELILDYYILAYRTWRILFRVENREILVYNIYSGYTQTELEVEYDKYGDKELHRRFLLLNRENEFLIKI